MKIINTKLLLALFALLGTLVAWAVINIFIIDISLMHYFIIEIIITVLHLLYNKAKDDFLKIS